MFTYCKPEKYVSLFSLVNHLRPQFLVSVKQMIPISLQFKIKNYKFNIIFNFAADIYQEM